MGRGLTAIFHLSVVAESSQKRRYSGGSVRPLPVISPLPLPPMLLLPFGLLSATLLNLYIIKINYLSKKCNRLL